MPRFGWYGWLGKADVAATLPGVLGLYPPCKGLAILAGGSGLTPHVRVAVTQSLGASGEVLIGWQLPCRVFCFASREFSQI